MNCGLVHHLYYGFCGGDAGREEEDSMMLVVLVVAAKTCHWKLKHATTCTGYKGFFYNMCLKADCCTGVSLDEEARKYFTKNGFVSVQDEIKSTSKTSNIHDIINLDSSSSDDSSVFMPREVKKDKDNKGKGKDKRNLFTIWITVLVLLGGEYTGEEYH
eukprot:12330223-Ditylum_brightwellii.AAC.1